MLRICNKCKLVANTDKDLDLFVVGKTSKYGRQNKCKNCANMEAKTKYNSAEYIKQWRKLNEDVQKPKQQLQCKLWRENNRDRHNAKEAKRRADKLKLTPKLTLDDVNRIKIKYRIAQIMSKLGKTNYHVDHIFPLAKNGLHHPDNLQILNASVNMSKGSRILTTRDKFPKELKLVKEDIVSCKKKKSGGTKKK